MGRRSQPVPKGARGIPAATSQPLPRGDALARRVRLLRRLGFGFSGATLIAALGVLAVFLGLVYLLFHASGPAIERNGWGFLTGGTWDPVHNIYGALPAIEGTLITSFLALLLAVPVALGVAVFLSELAPRWLAEPLGQIVDLSAAIPSVVYGFWAFLVLVPAMKNHIEPSLASLTGGGPPFSGYPLGLDFLSASLVLAIMILPTIAAFAREALQAVPRVHREAALSLGATRWEATRITVLGTARPGIEGAILLGLGRGIGETIAVTMVLNNIYQAPTSLFSPGETMTSWIANDFGPAGPVEFQSLVELALVLLAITILVNVVARLLLRRVSRGSPSSGRSRWPWIGARHKSLARPRRAESTPDPVSASGAAALVPPAAAWRVAATRRAPARAARRRMLHAIVVAVTLACVGIALLPFVSVLHTSLDQGGAAVLQPSFYTGQTPYPCNPRPGNATVAATTCPIGGIGPAIEGTLILLGIGSAIAFPAGIFAGIYLSEHGRGRFARVMSFFTDVMIGVPTILIGVFIYLVMIALDHDAATSALAGSLALSVVMLPVVTRATEEALSQVPVTVREAALALGFPRHRVTLRVVLGCARGALVTGLLLALARAAGDTASLILTAGATRAWFTGLNHPVAALTPLIFNNFFQSQANWTEDAWGATLVLLLMILVLNLVARFGFGRRNRAGAAE